jgi:hypothetical protein
MGKIATTLSLMKASWQILKKDRELQGISAGQLKEAMRRI